MRRLTFLSSLAILLCGCQATRVRNMSNHLGSTVPDLYFQEVLDNIAMTRVNPSAMPYFGIPAQGTSANTRQSQGSYSPGWDLVTAGTRATAALFGRYLFDKQSAMITGSNQDAQTFQVTPMSDPDKLLLIQAAFRIANQIRIDPELGNKMQEFFDAHKQYRNYANSIKPCWFVVTENKLEAHSKSCYVGEYRSGLHKLYVYVPPANLEDLTNFTLAILDIATIDQSRLAKPKADTLTVTIKNLEDAIKKTETEMASHLLSNPHALTDIRSSAHITNQGFQQSLTGLRLELLKAQTQQALLNSAPESFGPPRMLNPVVSPPPNFPTLP